MRKLPEETVSFVVELLLCGWTPQDVVASGFVAASLPRVQRIARVEGLAAPRGGGSGRGPRSGAGRKPTGRGCGTKYSEHRARAIELRSKGLSLRAVAAELGLRSPETIRYLTGEPHKKSY